MWLSACVLSTLLYSCSEVPRKLLLLYSLAATSDYLTHYLRAWKHAAKVAALLFVLFHPYVCLSLPFSTVFDCKASQLAGRGGVRIQTRNWYGRIIIRHTQPTKPRFKSVSKRLILMILGVAICCTYTFKQLYLHSLGLVWGPRKFTVITSLPGGPSQSPKRARRSLSC